MEAINKDAYDALISIGINDERATKVAKSLVVEKDQSLLEKLGQVETRLVRVETKLSIIGAGIGTLILERIIQIIFG